MMRIGSNVTTPLTVNDIVIESVDTFSYLGSIISAHGGSEEDVLHKVRESNNISRKTKLGIFDSSVKSVLLYGSTTCLRRILRIYWPNTISTNDLLDLTNNIPVEKEIKKRKWTWIGHVPRRPDDDIAKSALQ
ncbi:uncharacterized protein [Musca autumnalis]|uniref:uncharacterized protein n=1 Tax=Musca autumnalis TaxID=221902 RepID=UPI003CEFD0F9